MKKIMIRKDGNMTIAKGTYILQLTTNKGGLINEKTSISR